MTMPHCVEAGENVLLVVRNYNLCAHQVIKLRKKVQDSVSHSCHRFQTVM